MEHSHVITHDIVSRYVAGQLADEEARAFEAHFLDCPACLEQLEIEQALRAGLTELRDNVSAGPVKKSRVVSMGAFASAAAILLAAGTTIGYVQERREAEAARAKATALQRQYDEAIARPADAAPERPPHVAVFEIDATRSAAPSGSASPIVVPPSTSLVVFSLAVGNAADYSAFDASVRTAAGAEVLRQNDLQRASATSVAVALDPVHLSSGDYTIVLEGQIRDRAPVIVGRYSLRIVRR